jgi:acrylyl-CoA reductase (NADPH)
MGKTYQCLLTSEDGAGKYINEIVTQNTDDLRAGEVLIRVHYSSLNYKDALSAMGNKGVTRQFPHTPGIDAAGIVEESTDGAWTPGDQVIVTGFDLGMNTNGGFSEYIRVPARWLVRLPASMTLRESMIYGTAGFTAAMSVATLISNDVRPDAGSIAVSGASGGVGSIAVGILHKLGYQVAAISSKATSREFLNAAGADEIIERTDMEDQSGKPLLKPRFAAAVDTVGGAVLATLLKSVAYGGTVTACGMVNGADLPVTVFPFILRAIQLSGIDSAEFAIEKRPALWQKLADEWKPANLELFAEEIGLGELPEKIALIIAGKMEGRAIVRLI